MSKKIVQAVSTVAQSQKGKKAAEDLFLRAVVLGKVEDVRKCIEKGVDINVADEKHEMQTALHITAEKGDVAIGKLLFAQKSLQVNARTTFGNTPLMVAVLTNTLNLVQMLLRYGANPNISNYAGITPLHQAAQRNYFIVAELLAYKALPNVVDAFGNTPLSLCIIEHPSKPIATCLLKKGADPNIRSITVLPVLLELCLDNPTPEHYHLVQLLLDYKADPNITNPTSQQTPLHMTSITGSIAIAKLLLKMGANPDAKDLFQRTPVDVATEHGHQDLISFYKHRKRCTLEVIQLGLKQGPKKNDSFLSVGSATLEGKKSVKFTQSVVSYESEDQQVL